MCWQLAIIESNRRFRGTGEDARTLLEGGWGGSKGWQLQCGKHGRAMRLLTLTLRRKVEGRASNSCSESPPAGTLIMRAHTVSFASCLQIVVDQGRRWCPRIHDCSLAWSSAGNDG
jgi:hypothetical protein